MTQCFGDRCCAAVETGQFESDFRSFELVKRPGNDEGLFQHLADLAEFVLHRNSSVLESDCRPV